MKPKNESEKIILGVDPGTQIMGYGILLVKGNQVSVLQFGIIRLSKYAGHELRLKKIFDRIVQIIDEFHPDEMALEAPFYAKNVQSMLKLGRAQGVAMAAALSRDIPITEYLPKRVKQSVTGNGNASKEQVASMVKTLLKFEAKPEFLDATDALAVALCHHYSKRSPRGSNSTWMKFIQENPGRIAGNGDKKKASGD